MKRRVIPSIFVILGVFFLGSILTGLLLRIAGTAPISGPFVAGVATSLPFAAVLVAGGYALTRDVLPVEYYPHLALGTLAGMTFFLVFFSLIAVALFDAWGTQAAVLLWGLTVGGGNGFLISFLYTRGVSREVAVERTTAHAEQARRQQELLDYLNALLRHEVLNTATAIKAHADLADEAAENDAVQERVTVIQRQTDGLTSVIDDVQILLESAEPPDESEAVALAPLVREELRSLQDRYGSVETETDLSEGLYVRGDDLLRRAFSNLFENAVEHNENATPTVAVRTQASSETVAVHVEDDGPGFPTDDLEEVTEPLSQMDTSHGLGLAIVSRLAERYDGGVELAETGPDGSVVSLSLPRVRTDFDASRLDREVGRSVDD